MRAGIFSLIALTFAALASSSCGMAQDFVRATSPPALLSNFSPFSRVGVGFYAGLGGAGVDLATPLARKFNVRAGAEYFSYSPTFQDQGADVAIQLADAIRPRVAGLASLRRRLSVKPNGPVHQ